LKNLQRGKKVRGRKKEWSRREEEEGESFGSFLPWSLRSHAPLSPMTLFFNTYV
jgi:hypothetical protein